MCTNYGATAPNSSIHPKILELLAEDRSEFRPLGEIMIGDPTFARAQLVVMLGLIVKNETDSGIVALASAALDNPSPATLRPLLDLAHGRGWEHSLLDALANCAVASADRLFGDRRG